MEDLFEGIDFDDLYRDGVFKRYFSETLLNRLNNLELDIFNQYVGYGKGIRQIARDKGVSHVYVLKILKKIGKQIKNDIGRFIP